MDNKEEFTNYAIGHLKLFESVKQLLVIIFQDFYLLIDRMSRTDNRELDKIKESINKEKLILDEGYCNRQKDKAIRQLLKWELARQWTRKVREEQGKIKAES